MSIVRVLIPFVLALGLSACGAATQEPTADTPLDQELADAATGDAPDPMLRAALAGPIMVDPTLTQQANRDAVRPPAQPYGAPIPVHGVAAGPASELTATASAPDATTDCPQCRIATASLTLGALAHRQADPAMRACAPHLAYSARWATRLPADTVLAPGARVVEAAGVDRAGCRLRAATFSVGAPLTNMVDWYHDRTTKAGYTSVHQSDGVQHVLEGRRARDGAAYTLFLTTRSDGGTDVDMLVNRGS